MVLYTLCKMTTLGRPPLPLVIGRHLTLIRHQLEPTDEERDAEHLASAADLHELESRIRDLDRRLRQRRGPFHHFRCAHQNTRHRSRLVRAGAMSASQFGVGSVMQSAFVVGQLVRVRGTGPQCEVVRVLPVTEDGVLLYVIRSEQGAERITRHHELARA